MDTNLPSAPDGYSLIQKIGRGGYSEVWKGVHIESQMEVAIKIFRKSGLTKESDIAIVRNEIEIHQSLSHRYVVQLFDVKETLFNFYLIMELVPSGTLNDLIKTEAFLIEKDFQSYFAQIIAALDYLHNEKNIGHMDLKPQNVLLDEDNNIRISDFGLSKKFPTDSIQNPKQGTLHYFAPERLTSKVVTKAVDIWSIGVILFYGLTGEFPFEGMTKNELIQNILNTEPRYPDFLPNSIIDLLKGMLKKDPTERMTLNDIKQNEWVANALKQEPPLIVKYAALCPKNLRFLETIKGQNRLHTLGSTSSPGIRQRHSEAMLRLFSSGKFKAIEPDDSKKKSRHHRTMRSETNPKISISQSTPSDLKLQN